VNFNRGISLKGRVLSKWCRVGPRSYDEKKADVDVPTQFEDLRSQRETGRHVVQRWPISLEHGAYIRVEMED